MFVNRWSDPLSGSMEVSDFRLQNTPLPNGSETRTWHSITVASTFSEKA